MKEPFLYIIECIICSGLFLAIYRLFIVRATEFRVSRFFLLLAMIGACTIPLLQIPVWPSEAKVVPLLLLWDIHGDASEVESLTFDCPSGSLGELGVSVDVFL